jgi:hypothetical protein
MGIGGKWSGRAVNRSLQSRAEVERESGAIPLLPPHAFTAQTGTTLTFIVFLSLFRFLLQRYPYLKDYVHMNGLGKTE